MNYYDEISEAYDILHGHEQLVKVRIILNELEINPHDKLLDVGCGNGFYLDLFNCHVIGIDPSEDLVKQYKGKHKVKLGRAENLKFHDKHFDIVISITAIHNFKDIEKGLKEIERVGKDRFVFSVLQRSPRFGLIQKLIYDLFVVKEKIIQGKDVIFFCTKKV